MNNPYWTRHLTNVLLEADPVERTRLYNDRINVWYKTGFRRSYVYRDIARRRWSRPICREESKFQWPIDIQFQFAWDPLNQAQKNHLKNYFHVTRACINKLSYIEKEVLIQELLMRIDNSGYLMPHITEHDIDEDIKWMHRIEHVFYRGVYDIYAACGRKGWKPGQKLIEKYYPIETMHRGDDRRTLINAFQTNKIIFVALQHIVNKTKWDINISTIHNMLYRMRYGPRWFNPVVWKIILAQLFDIDNRTIVDLSPNINEKVITAGLLGCKYSSVGPDAPKAICDKLTVTQTEIQKPYDLAIFDNYIKPPELATLMQHIEESNELIAYVPRHMASEVQQAAKPSRIVKLKVTPLRVKQNPDYLFVYSAKI